MPPLPISTSTLHNPTSLIDMKCTFPAIAAAVTLIVASTHLHALPEWNIDFEGMTPGQSPTTATFQSGQVNTNPQSVSGLIVEEDYTPDAPGAETMFGNSAVFSFLQGESFSMTLSGAADATPNVDFLVGFDILVDSTKFDGAASNVIDVRLRNGAATNTNIIRIIMERDGEDIRLLSDGVYGIDTTYSNAWTLDTVHRVELLYTSSNLTYQLFVDGQFIGSEVSSFDQSPDEIMLSNILFTRGTANLGATGALDNILVTIPEPGTLMLAVLGLLPLLTRRFRRG